MGESIKKLGLTGISVLLTSPAFGGPLPMQFAEVAQQIGVDAQYQLPSGALVSPMLGGMAAADFNRDGLDDLFLIGGGGQPDLLLIAEQTVDGVQFTDQAAAWGVDSQHIGAGVSVADYNNDGYLDMYVTSHGPPSGQRRAWHKLYRNNGPDQQGEFSFTDVAFEAGVQATTELRADGFSSSWGDIDLDGDLDLVVAGWIGNSGGNRLFENNGDGTFSDVTADAIAFEVLDTRGFTPRLIDVTGDTFPEILMAADYGTSVLLRNDGTGNFTDFTNASNTSQETNGMGATNADFNNDGMVDWYVTSIYNDATNQDGNKLYLNTGGGIFSETSVAAGVDDGGWGWGAAAGDLDLDGDVDIVETNGWSGSQWIVERAYVFLNDGDGSSFDERGEDSGISFNAQGRSVLLWDMDRDGDLDSVFGSINAPFAVYRNDRAQRSPANWINIRLDTSASDSNAPDGVGATVTIVAGNMTQHRWVQANSDYLAQRPIEAHFGLGDAEVIDQVVIQWANGTSRTLNGLAINASHVLAACDADTDGNGVVTTEDVMAYIDAFVAGVRRADLLPDGRLNFFDIVEYIRSYREGCPDDKTRRTANPSAPSSTQTVPSRRDPTSARPAISR
ncbi:MAG: FG-GAP-like repeat-containing protein [Phycisphaerales bacterium]